MFHYDLAIVGGGPAGIAAATMALNLHLNFIVIAPNLGGKVNYGFSLRDLPNAESIWGAESVLAMEKQFQGIPERHIKESVSAITQEETGIFRMTLVGAQGVEQSVRASTVIIATGASPRRLHIDGEEEYWGRGVSYSTVSHAGYMKGRDVAVIGLGIRAATAALRLSTIANHVYLIPKTALTGDDSRIKQVMNHPKITLMEGWSPQRFTGDEFLQQISLIRDRDFKNLEVDAAFIEMGLIPDKGFARGVIKFDPETGQIPINRLCETAVEGLYAAGDVTDIFAEQIPVAVGEGIKATLSAWEYLARKS